MIMARFPNLSGWVELGCLVPHVGSSIQFPARSDRFNIMMVKCCDERNIENNVEDSDEQLFEDILILNNV